jgi:hypothetical protein
MTRHRDHSGVIVLLRDKQLAQGVGDPLGISSCCETGRPASIAGELGKEGNQ